MKIALLYSWFVKESDSVFSIHEDWKWPRLKVGNICAIYSCGRLSSYNSKKKVISSTSQHLAVKASGNRNMQIFLSTDECALQTLYEPWLGDCRT